ncbi:MAG: 7-cyano-7-deazaguanine synthase QueC [Acidobacteria bacterium RIFCSPLOWO2_12_FULL_67_14b]|nr:MAG: 7-cyano-7-deazaguanine synthase QueC [Acidobacteria bacterium RIFCSPLOWO2_12_FULL_67_14b]
MSRAPGSGLRESTTRDAVVLLSGGLDSYTAAAVAKRDGFRLFALSINYGQRHAQELEAARAVAVSLGVERHLELALDLSRIGGSALTSTSIEVPKDQPIDPAVIPTTYVPARNTIFLSLALGWAEVLGASDIFIGVNAVDYSGYPDCRPEFIRAFEQLARLATRAGVEGRPLAIHTPLITLSKAAIVRLGLSLGLDYGLTHSCYDPGPNGRACGRCDSCRLRAAGFAEAGAPDPLIGPVG